MNSTIGVYKSHSDAVKAVETLADEDFPVNQISILAKAEIIDNQMRTASTEIIKNSGVGIGVVLGSVLGTLTGAGVFAIPGLGFLFGAGALIGALAGFDLGLVGGGIASLLTTIGIKKDHLVKFNEHLCAGRFLVIAHGDAKEIERAKRILHLYGEHVELIVHAVEPKKK